jgi:putative Mg2+ transporter-C (MgtC) family protein
MPCGACDGGADMTDYIYFAFHSGAALLMGAALGLERQYRGHPAGLRTNALVSVGAALFVALGGLYVGTNVDPTRIASYVVSGIGFLGGGVILREGFNVRGMNTAATLWCTAAVGSLCGAGFVAHALAGALLVLTIHIGLRPVAHWIDLWRKTSPDVETAYRVRVVCEEKDQALVRTIVLRHLNAHKGMIVQGIALVDCDQANRIAVAADVFSHQRDDRAMEELVTRLNIEPGVVAVSWERRQ